MKTKCKSQMYMRTFGKYQMRDDETSKNNGPIKEWIKSESSTRTKDFNGCARDERNSQCAFVRFCGSLFFVLLAYAWTLAHTHTISIDRFTFLAFSRVVV